MDEPATMQFQYEDEEYNDDLDEVEIETEEGITGNSCDNCHRSDNPLLVGGKMCENCHRYYQRHGTHRPQELEDERVRINDIRAPVLAAPVFGGGNVAGERGYVKGCWNCKTTTTSDNRWTKLSDGNILCRNCARFRKRNGGKDRPLKFENMRRDQKKKILVRTKASTLSKDKKGYIAPSTRATTAITNAYGIATHIGTPMRATVARLRDRLNTLVDVARGYKFNGRLFDGLSLEKENAMEADAEKLMQKMEIAKEFRDAEDKILDSYLEDGQKVEMIKSNYNEYLKQVEGI